MPSCSTWPVLHAPGPSGALAGRWATSYSVSATWTENCCRLMDLRRVRMAACRLCSARFRVQSAPQVSAGWGDPSLAAPASGLFPEASPPSGAALAGPRPGAHSRGGLGHGTTAASLCQMGRPRLPEGRPAQGHRQVCAEARPPPLHCTASPAQRPDGSSLPLRHPRGGRWSWERVQHPRPLVARPLPALPASAPGAPTLTTNPAFRPPCRPHCFPTVPLPPTSAPLPSLFPLPEGRSLPPRLFGEL